MQFYIPVNISNPVTNMCHLTLKIVSIWAIYVMFTKTRVLSANTWIDKEHVSVGGGLGLNYWGFSSVQFSSVAQSCLTLCNPTNHSTPGLPVHHQLPESTQTHVHWVGDAIQPSHPLLSPSPPALNFSQHQGLFKQVSSSHQVAKVLEFQFQHQSF